MAKREERLESTFEKFTNRVGKRKPQGRRSVGQLVVSESEARAAAVRRHEELEDIPAFKDPGLQQMYEEGLLTELLVQLKSGKEATVYMGRGPGGLVAAKIYTDLAMRSFKNDQLYREGRHIGDQRMKKAIEQHSAMGARAQQALWIQGEYSHLCTLHEAGVCVPLPIAQYGRALLMEFIGDESGPAPRISELRLKRNDAEDAFEQSVWNLVQMLRAGYVHGDYSAFNLLWWKERIVVIDLPQSSEVERNPNAHVLLRRDVNSLCGSFARHGLHPNPAAVLRRVMELAGSA